MAKAKEPFKTEELSSAVTSYAVLTAEAILRGLNLAFSKQEINDQINSKDAFYKRILSAPAASIYNRYLIIQCDELESYNQSEVINMLFARMGLPEEIIRKPSQFQALLDRLREQTEQQAKTLITITKKQKELDLETQETLKKVVAEWRDLQKTHAAKIVSKLAEQGITLDKQMEEKLLDLLDKQGLETTLNSETLKKLNDKNYTSSTANAVIQVLLEAMTDVK